MTHKNLKNPDAMKAEQDFLEWKFGLDNLYSVNLDCIEIRYDDGPEPRIAALIEASSFHTNGLAARDAVLARFTKRAASGIYERFAQYESVDVWLVVHDVEITEFHVYNFTKKAGWWITGKEGYERWLKKL